MFCRLQVAGWNLIITRKPLALRGNVQAVDLPWLLQDAVYDCSVRLLPNNAKLAEVMAGGYIPMISSLKWIVSFEEASEISSEIAAEFGFFPVNTKMRAQWACASILRRLKSYIISFLYLCLAIFCCWVKNQAKSGIDRNICGATIQMALKRIFTGISLVSAYQSIMTYRRSSQKSITSRLKRVTPITMEGGNVQVKLTSKSKENTSISASSKWGNSALV